MSGRPIYVSNGEAVNSGSSDVKLLNDAMLAVRASINSYYTVFNSPTATVNDKAAFKQSLYNTLTTQTAIMATTRQQYQ